VKNLTACLVAYKLPYLSLYPCEDEFFLRLYFNYSPEWKVETKVHSNIKSDAITQPLLNFIIAFSSLKNYSIHPDIHLLYLALSNTNSYLITGLVPKCTGQVAKKHVAK